MNLINLIEENIATYNDSRRVIGEYILKEKDNIAKMTMEEIANNAYVSKTTLFRYAETLGYSGWKEFVQAFSEELYYIDTYYSDVDPNIPFGKEDTIEDIVNKVTQIQIESLQETAKQIKKSALENAANKILSTKGSIVLFGISPNNILAKLFQRKLRSIGILTTVVSMDESGLVSNALTKDDIAIIISYSGNNKEREPMRYVETLKSNNVELIAITSQGDNYLSEQINCILTVSTRERLYSKVANFTSEESILHILNLLYACCFAKNYERNYNFKVKNAKKLEYRRGTSIFNLQEDYEF